jgi:hypothetical protein
MATPNVNVPAVAGVPAIDRNPIFIGGALALLSGDMVPLPSAPFATKQWGIFLGGAPVVSSESVVGVEFRGESLISDYPVEQGSFASYDKVQLPFDVRLRFAAGSNQAARAALIASIEAIANDTNLYDVVTPEYVYTSVSVAHRDYHRTARQGVGLIVEDVWLLQIQIVAPAQGSNTAQPDGQSPVNGGLVSPANPSASAISNLNAANVAGAYYEP